MSTKSKSSRTKPRLGRGLSSLIVNSADLPTDDGEYQHVTGLPPVAEPDKQPLTVPAAPAGPQEIPVGEIAPNPYQPRRRFSDQELGELTESIRQQGVLQPLLVAKAADADANHPYVLIAGERRLRASQTVGLASVPCVVREATPQQMLEWAIVENIQRADLNPIERAAAYREYMDRFSLSQSDAAQRLGQPRTTVANHLRLLDLQAPLQQMLIDGALTFGHAKVLASLTGAPEKQLALARRTVSASLSVRQLEGLVAAVMAEDGSPAKAKRAAAAKPPHVRELEDDLTRLAGTRVTIQPGRAKNTGRVSIDYYSLDDFDRISAMLGYKSDM